MANEVKIQVNADTEKAQKNLRGLRGAMDKVRKHARAAGVAMTAFGAAATAAVGFSVKAFAEMGDEVQKMALRTGFSTEALSELRFAAQIAGTDINSLEKGVKRMAKAITDADEGLTESIRSFDRLGIAVEDIVGLKPEEQFFKIINALAGVADTSTRAATAQELLGRAGTQLLPLVALGAEGIAELRDRARELGVSFAQDSSNKAAEFQDALTELKASVTGVAIQIGSTLAPTLTDLAGKVTNIIIEVRKWASEHPALTKAIVAATAVVGGLLVVLGPLLIMLPGIVAIAPAVAAAFSTMFGPVGLGAAALGALAVALGVGLGKLINAVQDTSGTLSMEEVREKVSKLSDETIRLGGGIEVVTAAVAAGGQAFENLRANINAARQAELDVAEAMDKARDSMAEQAREAEIAQLKMERWIRIVKLGDKHLDLLHGSLDALHESLDDVNDATARWLDPVNLKRIQDLKEALRLEFATPEQIAGLATPWELLIDTIDEATASVIAYKQQLADVGASPLGFTTALGAGVGVGQKFLSRVGASIGLPQITAAEFERIVASGAADRVAFLKAIQAGEEPFVFTQQPPQAAGLFGGGPFTINVQVDGQTIATAIGDVVSRDEPVRSS